MGEIVKFLSDLEDTGLRVTGYGDGYVTVAEQRLQHSFLITPDRLHPRFPLTAVRNVTWSSLQVLHRSDIEILLLGTGPRQEFPAPDLYAELAARGIGLEVMDTPAACRTYNILAGEGRRVAALMLL